MDTVPMALPTDAAAPSDRTAPAAPAVLVTGLVLLALNSRVPFGQIGPLEPKVGFGAGLVTLLGLLPPLLMGLCAPFAPWLRRHLGDERALFWAGVVLLAGAILRPFGLAGLVCGTAVVSAAIAIVNVVVPVWIRRRFHPRRVGTMMGIYALCMGGGSALVATLMVPVLTATGSWHVAIAVAIVPAALAALGMAPQLGQHTPLTSTDRHQRPPVARTWVAWSLLSFFGIQTLLFYAVLAWLPSVLVAAGTPAPAAGGMLSILLLAIAAGGFVSPTMAGRRKHLRPLVLATIGCCAAGLAGLLAAPLAATFVWVVLLGLGLGSGQALPGVLFARHGHDHDHTAALSTMAQTGGFLLAATGPVLMSTLHGRTGTWGPALWALLILLAVNVGLSWSAGRVDPAPQGPRHGPFAGRPRIDGPGCA